MNVGNFWRYGMPGKGLYGQQDGISNTTRSSVIWTDCKWGVPTMFCWFYVCALTVTKRLMLIHPVQCREASQNVKRNQGESVSRHTLVAENFQATALILNVCLTPFTSVQTACSSTCCLLTLCSYTEPKHYIITDFSSCLYCVYYTICKVHIS